MEILRTERLSKTYGQGPAATQALRDVTFSVEQGSFSAIVGRSGSGKTTLLNLLGGLDTPTAGQVFYRGQSLYDLPRRQRDGFRRPAPLCFGRLDEKKLLSLARLSYDTGIKKHSAKLLQKY